jgi:signal transduction histidine kinase
MSKAERTHAASTKPVLVRVIGWCAVVGLILAACAPMLFRRMLLLDAGQFRYTFIAFGLGIAATFATTTAGLLVSLRGVSGARADDEAARRRVLRLPARMAGQLAIIGSAVTGAAMALRVLTSHDGASLIFGVGLTSAALVGFLAVPMYVGVRAALLPYALFFANERLPSGRRMPIGLLAGYTVLSVAGLALAPSAVFGNARLAVVRAQAEQARALSAAQRLAQLVDARDAVEAARLVGHVRLDDAIVLLRTPAGPLVPEDQAREAGNASYAEVPLWNALAGGAVRVVPQPRGVSQAPLIFLVVGLVGLAMLVAGSLARQLSRDARGVTQQIEALAEGVDPPRVGTVSASEVRRVALAVNRLLERIPRLQMEKYLAVERATESRRLKAMFLANMSHDLRSPLNSILGFSELLTRGLEGPITDNQRRLLDDVNTTGNQLLRLLSEILDTARAESGHFDLDRKPTPPASFVAQARKEALRGRPERLAERLRIDLQPGVTTVTVDALRMQQALTHVLNWALDAAHGAEIVVDVGDRDRTAGRAFVIDVVCDAPGNAADEAHMFQAFRKVPGVAGLHLALPLARRIVEAHRGTIEPNAEGRLGVRMILPRGQSRLHSRPTLTLP